MWTEITWRDYERRGGRYASDMTDREWALLAPFMPARKKKGFEVLPRRWVVERTFTWLGRCRRLAKDWEKTIASAEAWLLIAHIRLVTRRLARYCYET